MSSAGSTSICSFASFIASWQRRRRSRGSEQLVGMSAMMPPTRLVQGSSSSPVRIDTGTIARSGASGSASCRSRYSRKAPVQIAITTSLTVHPVASFNALMLPSAVERIANRRCGVTARLNGVGGAGDNGMRTRCTGSRVSIAPPKATDLSPSRTCAATADTLSTPAASAKLRSRRNDSRIPLTGFMARLRMVRSSRIRSDGTASPTQST